MSTWMSVVHFATLKLSGDKALRSQTVPQFPIKLVLQRPDQAIDIVLRRVEMAGNSQNPLVGEIPNGDLDAVLSPKGVL